MANSKISALTALTGDDVDNAADVMPIVDTSASLTKKITVGELGTALRIVNINVNYTIAYNVGAGDDDLMTYTLPANTLSSDGKGVKVTAYGTYANNVNAKTLTFHVGAATYSTSLVPSATGHWYFEAYLIRDSATTALRFLRCMETENAPGIPRTEISANTQISVTHSSAITIKFSGSATDTLDIVQRFMAIEFIA